MRLGLFASIIFAVVIAPKGALACKCASPPPGLTSAKALAEWRAQSAGAIFEGTVESAEVRSPLIQANVGDLISADLDQSTPVVVVKFRVSRAYRGIQQEYISIETGLGGGDCGFPFEIGKQYLVYADRGDSGRLQTGICSGTARLEESGVNLDYLRGEPITATSARASRPASPSKLCVHIEKGGAPDFEDDRVLLLRVGTVSPIPSDEAEAGSNGTFCANGIDPGQYRLLFTEAPSDSPTSFVFYPGVMKVSDATPISVRPGQSTADLVFKIPSQSTFAVRGKVSASGNSRLPSEAKVMLLSEDQPFFTLAYSQNVESDGTFQFPKVLAGKYWAFVDVESDGNRPAKPGWATRKTEVIVDQDIVQLPLTLIAN